MTSLLMAVRLAALPSVFPDALPTTLREMPLAPSADTITADTISAPAASDSPAARLLVTASRYLGVRYRFGGTTPNAFDCSGFVRHVFRRHGIELPRLAREQIRVGTPVAGGIDSLRVGDLLFFRTRRGPAGHVAIYAGDGRIIHASAGSRRVRYDELASRRGRWFVTRLTAVRRVLLDDPPATVAGDNTLASATASVTATATASRNALATAIAAGAVARP